MTDDLAFVDFEEEPDPALNRLTNLLIGACIEVHRHLGAGYLEAYYEEALAKEFELRGISVSRQHPFAVTYKGFAIGTGRLDFLVEGKVILDLKAVDQLSSVFTAQMISYLRAMNCRLGLIVNFNVKLLKDGIKRIAN
jgi:GxxExxY protein